MPMNLLVVYVVFFMFKEKSTEITIFIDRIRIQLPFVFSVKPHKQFFPKRRGNNNFPYSQVDSLCSCFIIIFLYFSITNPTMNLLCKFFLQITLNKDSAFSISTRYFRFQIHFPVLFNVFFFIPYSVN